jgi:hypothetical protein
MLWIILFGKQNWNTVWTERRNRGMFLLRSHSNSRTRTTEPPMRTYLITYDLARTARHSLTSTIMQLGDAWARPLENTWYVQSAQRADAIERGLRAHIEGEDALLVQPVESDAVLLNTALRWFRKRTVSSEPNVVAFPVSGVPEARAA